MPVDNSTLMLMREALPKTEVGHKAKAKPKRYELSGDMVGGMGGLLGERGRREGRGRV